MKTIYFFLISTCLLIVTNTSVLAQPGSLDNTFGTGGKVTVDFGNLNNTGNSVAIQTDGKIVLAGSTSNGYDSDFALIRCNTDGTLDTAFGTGGKVITDFAGTNDFCYSVVIQTDGKIVMAGSSYNGTNTDFALVRYDSIGRLDTTFGIGGKVSTNFGSSNDAVSLVTMQTDGKIVVTGNSKNSTDSDFALARYNSNGTLDNTFGSGGTITTDLGSLYDYGKSVTIQTDGKIVVTGYIENGVYYDFALVRYNTNGTLDNTFGVNGKVITDFASSNDWGYSVAIQTDGKIVIAGSSGTGTNYDFALVRYDSIGTLDTTFGIGGKVSTDFSGFNDLIYSVAIQPDGKIVTAGVVGNNSTNPDFALVRYDSIGTLDPTFGTGGKVTTDFSGFNDLGYSVALQTDGKIVMAGYSNNGSNYDFAVTRYNNSSLPTAISIVAEQDIKLNVYPNPFNSFTTIQLNAATKNAELNIYNVVGQKIKTIQNVSGQKVELQRDNLSNGVYFMQLSQDNKVIATNKLIITD